MPEKILKCTEPKSAIETPCSTGSSWRPPSMHCLLSFTFVTFFILWPLSTAASIVSWYRSYLVCSGLAYEIYSGGDPSKCVYCVVCYRVIVAPYIRSIGHVFAYLYTLDDDSERPMDYETSLLPKAFPMSYYIMAEQVYCKYEPAVWWWMTAINHIQVENKDTLFYMLYYEESTYLRYLYKYPLKLNKTHHGCILHGAFVLYIVICG